VRLQLEPSRDLNAGGEVRRDRVAVPVDEESALQEDVPASLSRHG
jgi:hypothetical protein